MDEHDVEYLVTIRSHDVGNEVRIEKRRQIIKRRLELEFGDGKVDVDEGVIPE